MITNFEELTKELTDYEMEMLDPICRGLANRSKHDPIKSEDIVKGMANAGYTLTGVRLRKIVNYIRSNAMLPVIATSKGYFTSTDKDEIEKQILSLKERANSILECADGLKVFLKN